MLSGSPLIGDVRDRTAASVTSSRKSVPSLHVQTTPGDAFADVFRLIANSPAASRAPSRGSEARAEEKKGKDDELQNAEKSSPPASDDPRASQQATEDVSPVDLDVSPVDLTLRVAGAEQTVAAGSEAVATPATIEGESDPQDGPLSKAELSETEPSETELREVELREMETVAASQHPTIVTAGSLDGEPVVTEVTSETAQVTREYASAGEPAATDETVANKPDAIKMPADATAEGNGQLGVGENVTTDGKPIFNPEAPVKSSGDASADPTLPKRPESLVTNPGEPGEAVADGSENEVTGEPGKPIFGGHDDENSESRRRRESDRQISPPTRDANRVRVAPSSAEMQGPHADVSPEMGSDASAADHAAREPSPKLETQQTNASAVPPPAVSAAAASGSAMSDAVSPKGSAKTAPQIGVAATQPAATENAQRPGQNGPSGPGVGDRIRLVQRVANAFQRLGVDGGQVRIRLHPADLGSVRLDLQIQGNRLNARVTAETEAARGVLREHLPDLRQRLAEQGIQVERIDVELETESQGNRDSPHQKGPTGQFNQPQRRHGRAGSLHPEHEQNESPRGVEVRRNPVGRSVTDAASRPGVDLVF